MIYHFVTISFGVILTKLTLYCYLNSFPRLTRFSNIIWLYFLISCYLLSSCIVLTNMINEIVIFNLYSLITSGIFTAVIINLKNLDLKKIFIFLIYYFITVTLNLIAVVKINEYPNLPLYNYYYLILFGYQAHLAANTILFSYKIIFNRNENKILLVKILPTAINPPRDTCSICLDNFYDEEKGEVINNVLKTKCNHYFHRDCLLNIQGELTCPLCRKNLKLIYFI